MLGNLAPGAYTLEAQAHTDVTTFQFADQTFADTGSAGFDLDFVLIPEPATAFLFAAGVLALALRRRRAR